MNCELPDIQAGFRKGIGIRDQIANICWIIEKAREFQEDGIIDSMDMSLSKLQEMVKDKEAWSAPVHVVTKSQT